MIGHSLGAHTAGYAGERIPGIGRITGLDPAEPYFQGMGPSIRLDPSDAQFVDVIHTDGRSFFLLEMPGYGMSQSCGHIDFYPNNGKEQPGCALSQEGGTLIPLTLIKDGIEEASRVLLACNHVRAIKLFIDSINGKCPYVGRLMLNKSIQIGTFDGIPLINLYSFKLIVAHRTNTFLLVVALNVALETVR